MQQSPCVDFSPLPLVDPQQHAGTQCADLLRGIVSIGSKSRDAGHPAGGDPGMGTAEGGEVFDEAAVGEVVNQDAAVV
jgi:hypothetical protein